MDKEKLIEQIHEILVSYYGKENLISGCYVNGRWLSVSHVERIIESNIDLYNNIAELGGE